MISEEKEKPASSGKGGGQENFALGCNPGADRYRDEIMFRFSRERYTPTRRLSNSQIANDAFENVKRELEESRGGDGAVIAEAIAWVLENGSESDLPEFFHLIERAVYRTQVRRYMRPIS